MSKPMTPKSVRFEQVSSKVEMRIRECRLDVVLDKLELALDANGSWGVFA